AFLTDREKEAVQAHADLGAEPGSRLDFLLGEPGEIGLLDVAIADGGRNISQFGRAAPVGLSEQSDPNVIEAALKADEGFHRQPGEMVTAAVVDVVAGQKTFVVLLDAVAVHRVIQKKREV